MPEPAELSNDEKTSKMLQSYKVGRKYVDIANDRTNTHFISFDKFPINKESIDLANRSIGPIGGEVSFTKKMHDKEGADYRILTIMAHNNGCGGLPCATGIIEGHIGGNPVKGEGQLKQVAIYNGRPEELEICLAALVRLEASYGKTEKAKFFESQRGLQEYMKARAANTA